MKTAQSTIRDGTNIKVHHKKKNLRVNFLPLILFIKEHMRGINREVNHPCSLSQGTHGPVLHRVIRPHPTPFQPQVANVLPV